MYRSLSKDQLFSTKPRLARSGSKSIIERSQGPLTKQLSGQNYDHQHSNEQTIQRGNSRYVEVVGRGYSDEKTSSRRLSNDSMEDKQHMSGAKSRAKIIKGK